MNSDQWKEAPTPEQEEIMRMMAARAFNNAAPPPPPIPVIKLNGKIISTPGNICNIQAGVKAGKTAAVGAILAAMFNGNRQGPDTLGFSSENVAGKAVIHFDTEQSVYDHDQLIRRALRRAWLTEPPAWFSSYCLTDLDIKNRKLVIEAAVREASARHGGVFAILIDGVADLCASPNDEAESLAFVGQLQADAITHGCAMLTVLHENPGSENGKMRGHLGSQLERKAETPLRLAKDPATGITTIWSDRARHNHFPKEDGACFQWSDEKGMHVSIGTAREIKAGVKNAKVRAEAEAAFGDAASLTYAELIKGIMAATSLTERTAERRVTAYQNDGVTVKLPSGNYALKP
jgi:hypothetical protein